MQASFPQLTPELQQAIAACGGLPIQVEDPDTHKLYVLVAQSNDTFFDDSYFRDELSKGIAALEAGEHVAWDPERIKHEGRRRLAARNAE